MAIMKGLCDSLKVKVRGLEYCIALKDIHKFRPASDFIKEMQQKYVVDEDYTILYNFKDTLYINKNAQMFENILDYFEYGELHLPKNTCLFILEKELKYWGFGPDDLAICCLNRLLKAKEENKTSKEISKQWMKSEQTDFTVYWSTSKVYKHIQSDHSQNGLNGQARSINSLMTSEVVTIKKKNQGKVRNKLAKIFLDPTSCLAAKVEYNFIFIIFIV
jgi:hypothetical protein